MRIVQLIDSATVGGAEENTALMASELARRGHQVLLLSPEGPYTSRFDALEGVRAARLPLRGPLEPARAALREALWEYQPHLVHSHMLRADVLLARQGRKTSYLRCTSLHNMFDREIPGRLRRLIYRGLAIWSYRRFEAILPVSDYVRRYAQAYLRVKDRKVRVVPNGIDAEGFRSRAGDDLAVPATSSKVVLSVGRLDRNKGQELVLRAARALDRGDLEVWFAGTGPQEGELRRLAADLGVSCLFLGRREDIPALMARADLVVQASRWEALGNAVLEALALGRPVVATRAGGTPEAVIDGATGWLAEVEDVSGLAMAMREVLDDPGEALRRGERGRALVDERYTIQAAAETLLAHPAVAKKVRVSG